MTALDIPLSKDFKLTNQSEKTITKQINLGRAVVYDKRVSGFYNLADKDVRACIQDYASTKQIKKIQQMESTFAL